MWPLTRVVTTQVVFLAKENQPITLEIIKGYCLHAAQELMKRCEPVVQLGVKVEHNLPRHPGLLVWDVARLCELGATMV